MSEPTALLKFQIGPVQDFIAQARSTRDLWSGSYLLSWLVAAGIRKLAETPGTELIFPNREGQPLLEDNGTFVSANQQKLLTPNIPNLFVARVLGDNANEVAAAVREAIEGEWKEIAKSVWKKGSELGLEDKYEARFNEQVARHLSITWMLTPVKDGDYLSGFGNNGWHLDAVRQTRDFNAWPSGTLGAFNEKDSLSGKEEAVAGGKDFAAEVDIRFKHLFKHDDHLGAANLIKRVWHLTYLQDVLKLRIQEFKIRSTRAIAARDDRNDDDENTDKSGAEKYLAAIAFDGDSIGAWISGDKLADQSELKEHHTEFSKSLSNFALGSTREIIEKDVAGSDKNQKVIQVLPLGFLIYAGGDDVVALVPADEAIECARQLRESFVAATKGTKPDKEGKKPDASAGIAIAHFKSPLQDLIREAQKGEKRAKNEVGRPAFSVTLMKRSGEISQWGAKWDSGGIELYDAIAKAMGEGDLRSKFPHRVCQLLAPYVTKQTGLIQMNDADGFNAAEVIRREFVHAAERQGSKAIAEALQGPLLAYLGSLGTDSQTQLTAIIRLCATVAFAHRNRSAETQSAETQSAERQPVA